MEYCSLLLINFLDQTLRVFVISQLCFPVIPTCALQILHSYKYVICTDFSKWTHSGESFLSPKLLNSFQRNLMVAVYVKSCQANLISFLICSIESLIYMKIKQYTLIFLKNKTEYRRRNWIMTQNINIVNIKMLHELFSVWWIFS
jgi:hypothetical protein